MKIKLRSRVVLLVLLFGCSDSEKDNAVVEIAPEVSEWVEAWSDEFDDENLDMSKWNILRWRPGWVNNEQQAYTNRDTNIYLELL